MALLALLAHAGNRGISRDQLMALLWPEEEPGGARRRLTQTLYALRNDLADDLFVGTGRITLAPSSVSCDLWDFRRAVLDERWDDAVALYRGPLLEGVFVGGAPEFERWVEIERASLQIEFLKAGVRAARSASHQGDHWAAIALWRRVTAVDPHNAEFAAGLARALADSGNRAGALSSIHGFGARLREELGLSQDGHLIELDQAIRREMAARSPTGNAVAAGPASMPTAGAQETVSPRLLRFDRRSFWGALVGGLAVAGLAAVSYRSRVPAGSEGPLKVVVLPFAVTGDSADSYLVAGTTRLIAESLDGAGPIQAAIMPPGLAATLRRAGSPTDTARVIVDVTGARRYVTGRAMVVNGTLRIQVTLHQTDRAGRVLGSATATGPNDSLFALADDLARQLVGLDPAAASGLTKSAALGTRSLAAFKAFVDGETHFRGSRFADAVTSFQHAVREDTTFGLAYYRLSQAYDWNAQGNFVAGAATAGLRHAEGLPWPERMLLEGSVLWREGRNDSAEARFRAVTTRYSANEEAWFALGEVLFHSNTIRGRPFREAGPAFERVVALNPTNRGALTHLARVEAYQGNIRRADSLLTAAGALMLGGPDAELRFFQAVVSGDSALRASALRSLSTDAGHLLSNAATRTAFYAKNLAEGDTVARLMQTGSSPVGGHALAALLAFGQGQFHRAFEEARAIGELEPSHGLEVIGHLATLPAPPGAEPERRALTRELKQWRAGRDEKDLAVSQYEFYPAVRLYYLAMLAIRANDSSLAAGYADSLEQISGTARLQSHRQAFVAGIRAHLLAASGHARRALSLLSTVHEAGDQGSQVMYFAGLESERFLRAGLLETLSRHDEALTVYESLVFGGSHEIVLAGVASLRRARILARLGRHADAIAAYRTFLETWAHAEAPSQPLVDSARAEMARLPRAPINPLLRPAAHER